jgi:hypothetical protein
MPNPNLTFAQLGLIFNAISNETTGGVSPNNQQLLLTQVNMVQQGVQNLVNNGAFTDGATITHAQNIADQMNFLSDQIGNYGNAQSAPQAKFINDVIRDVQDIVQGDPNLAAAAADAHAWQQVSNLLTPPTPFPDTPLQTSTLLKFIADSNDIAARAHAVANQGVSDPNLITDIQAFSAAADAYSQAQGGVFSARFNNEFTLDGVQGTASRELVNGLNNHDANLINGAADVLAANANDVRGNMLVTGQNPNPPNPPPAADSVHNAGLYFDDAATKLIGGVYAGNQASIVSDLNNAATGVQAGITANNLTGDALANAQKVIGLLGHEAGLVGGIDTAKPTPEAFVNGMIGADQAAILQTVNGDATLAGLADGSFLPNPPGARNAGQAIVATMGNDDHGNNGQGPGHGMAVAALAQMHPGGAAIAALAQMNHGHMDMQPMDLSHIWHHA